MLTTVKAALLGILQGLTEFLPISSTAHLLVAERLVGYEDRGGVFAVMIQLGSILAVMWLYRAKIIETVAGVTTRPEARHFALAIVAAFLPAALAGLFLADFVKAVLFNSLRLIAVAFVAGGIVMLILERRRPRPVIDAAERTTIGRAVGIGICQTLALIPGVSRSGATIIGGMLLGLDRAAAAEFSFFLAMPIMMGAFVHELIGVWDGLAVAQAGEIAVGFVMAFLAAAVVVKPFLNFVRRSGFAVFAWYRIVFGLALWAAVDAGLLVIPHAVAAP